jgi:methyltransferase (TIGR00027 family)
MVHDQHCDEHIAGPESSAARVALWRALHLEADAPPHVFSDGVGLQLLAPDADWRRRADMDERASRRPRASTVSRARFIEELVENQAGHGVNQYVILGAGLDTFAQRRPEIASRLTVFEVDQHQPQAWKRQRLNELGFGIPQWLRLVAVDFEAGGSLWERLTDAGFDTGRRAVIASTGVSMYLSRDAIVAMLREISTHAAAGSTLVMTFVVPLELVDAEERPRLAAMKKHARSIGTPFVSVFSPPEMLALARDAGCFREVRHVSAVSLAERYFSGRSDGLRPSSAEELLVATT